jgi:hypothetical protein
MFTPPPGLGIPVRILTGMTLLEDGLRVVSDTRIAVVFSSPGPYAGYEARASLDFEGEVERNRVHAWFTSWIGDTFTIRENDDSHSRGRYHRELVITHEKTGAQIATGGKDPR